MLKNQSVINAQQSSQNASESVRTSSTLNGLSASWYLVHTKPRQEDTALINLEQQGYMCYLPKLQIERIRRHKAEVVIEPMFPRYLFIQLNQRDENQSWAPIRSTIGVSQLVRFGTQIAKVDDRLLDLLRSRESTHPTESLFQPGEHVRVTEGPFIGFEAIYQTTDAERRSMILLEFLNKPVSVKINTAGLEKIAS